MTLKEIRQKFPQYNDMSDADLINGLHKKFYSDMPINDFYKKIGFNQASDNNSITNTLMNKLNLLANNPVTNAIINSGAGFAHGLYGGGKALINAIPQLTSGKDILNYNLPEDRFSDPSSMEYTGANIGGVVAPIALATMASEGALAPLIPNILARTALAGGASGFALTPGDTLERTLGGAASAALPVAARGLKSVFQKPTAKIADFIKNLTVNKSSEEINSSISQKIKDVFKNNIKPQNEQNYNNLDMAAKNAGYTNNIDKSLKSFLGGREYGGEKYGLPIHAYESQDSLQNLLNTKNVSNDLKNSIKKFLDNKSYQNSQELQKKLGSEGYDLKNPMNDSDLKLLGNSMHGIRRNLIQDIKNTFENNGHHELSDMLENASNYHLNNVVPYQKNTALRKIINPQKYGKSPSNIQNVLLSDDENISPVLNHLEQFSPKTNDLILFQKIAGGKPIFNAISGQPKINTENFFSSYGQLKDAAYNPLQEGGLSKNLKTVLTPERMNDYDELMKSALKYSKLKRNLKIGTGLATALGAGAAIPQLKKLEGLVGG